MFKAVQMSNVKEYFSFYVNRYNGNESYADILLYNITSDTIEKVLSLSLATSGGLVLKSKDANFICHFGGTSTRTAIQVLNPAKKITVTLNTVLPSDVLHSDGMTINQTAFICSGRTEKILEFNLASETVKTVGRFLFGNDTVISTAIITDNTSNRVWLSPGSEGRLNNRVMIYNSESKLTSTTHQNVSVPSLYFKPATVSTGRYGNIIRGLGRVPEPDGSKHSSKGNSRQYLKFRMYF
jgi:hypothetical protein